MFTQSCDPELGLPREGVAAEKLVPSKSFLWFRREESGTSQEFCRDVPEPWGCSKVWATKNCVHFSFPNPVLPCPCLGGNSLFYFGGYLLCCAFSPFFSRDFRGSVGIKNPCFLMVWIHKVTLKMLFFLFEDFSVVQKSATKTNHQNPRLISGKGRA